MKYTIVAGIGINHELGLDNKLLWRLSEDLKSFKALTTGKTMIMGRKTFESIGKALPNRETIILTRDKTFKAKGCSVFHSPEEIEKYSSSKEIEELIVVGGGEIYGLYLPKVSTMFISHVSYAGQSDTFFPKFEKNEWLVEELKHYPATEKSLEWHLSKYIRKL